MSSNTGNADDGVSGRNSLLASAGMGVVAVAIGYLLSYLLIRSEASETVGDQIADWKAVAWYFYNAHLVDIEMGGSIGSISGSESIDFLAESDATAADIMYLVPPAVLLLVGGLLAYHLGARDIGDAVRVGAPVAIGYAFVVGLGVFVVEESMEATVFGIELTGSVAPLLLPAVFLAGILYPLVFATVGATVVVLAQT